jgi:hypothetical protein
MDETRISDPEVLLVSFSHQGDAVALGQTGSNDALNATLPIKCHQLSGMKPDDFTGGCDDESVVRPRCGGAGDCRDVGPVTRELIVG